MTTIPTNFGDGGANLTSAGSNGTPTLAQTLRDVADDLAALKPTALTSPAAGGTYTAAEQTLLNELRTKYNALAAIVLKTLKG